MKFTSLLAIGLIPVFGLMAMPFPGFQEVGTANFSLCSSGDIGTTIGVFNEQNIKSEAEIDYNVSRHSSFGLGAKIGFDECTYGQYSPSFAVGTFNAQIRSRHELLSSNNVLYALTSKSYERVIVHFGVFHGNRTMGLERKGCFIGYTQHLIIQQVDETHRRSKLDLCGEYITGKSFLAGAKVELKYLISERINIKFGQFWQFYKKGEPVDPTIVVKIPSKWSFDNAKWLLTLSINV